MVLCLPAHSLWVEGAVLTLMLLLLQLHHLHTLLNFLASIPRLVNTRVIFLLAGGVVHVHHLHLAQGHHLLQHLHLTLLHVDGVADPTVLLLLLLTRLLLHDHDSPDIHTDSEDSQAIPHHLSWLPCHYPTLLP